MMLVGSAVVSTRGVISRVDVNPGNQVECLHHSILVVEILKVQAGFQQIIKRKLIVESEFNIPRFSAASAAPARYG